MIGPVEFVIFSGEKIDTAGIYAEVPPDGAKPEGEASFPCAIQYFQPYFKTFLFTKTPAITTLYVGA